MSNDDPNTDPLADDLFDSVDDSSVDANSELESDFDSAEFDSAEFDSAEFDGLNQESESRESEELQVAGQSESRESEEIPLDTTPDNSAQEDAGDEDEDEDGDVQQETSAAENEWLLASFFSAVGIYTAVALAFLLDRDVIMHPTTNIDWAFATILAPITIICFMSASLGMLSKPRGKQWLLLVPTLGPVLPIAVAALLIMALMNM
jgi:hypothetical protein